MVVESFSSSNGLSDAVLAAVNRAPRARSDSETEAIVVLANECQTTHIRRSATIGRAASIMARPRRWLVSRYLGDDASYEGKMDTFPNIGTRQLHAT